MSNTHGFTITECSIPRVEPKELNGLDVTPVLFTVNRLCSLTLERRAEGKHTA